MSEFSVLTWNVQGRQLYENTPFGNIMPFLDTTPAEILCLQEIPQAHKKLSLLKYFGQYHIVIPKDNICLTNQEHNHTVILSKYPVDKHGEVAFPKLNNGILLEKALWADLVIQDKIVRFYNCHLGLRHMGMRERRQQLDRILEHADNFNGPIVICGDMNTIIPQRGLHRRVVKFFHKVPDQSFHVDGRYFEKDERYIFPKNAEKKGYKDALDRKIATWCLPKFFLKCEYLKLKLDWFFIKDLQAKRLTYGPYISDHRPIFIECILSRE